MNYKLIAPRDDELTAIEQVLVNRGIPYKDIRLYLNLNDSVIQDPYGLTNIELGARRLLQAMLRQEEIYVQVDSDCDGYTSAAVLINYLHRVLPSIVENKVRYGLHTKKHHGIAVEDIPSGCTLVVAPDSSSNEADIHRELKANGIDVLVLDHHHAEPDGQDPAIIVNNQMCDYDNKCLSGVGVVYKFCKVLDDLIGVSYADDFLDLVALGMVADMMDLRSFETKRLIDIGCTEIHNPFFVYMAKKNDYSMKSKINPFTISFYVAPFINAITRSGNDAEKLLIFESLLDHRAMRLIPSGNRNRKGLEDLLVVEAIRVAGNVKKHQDDAKVKALDDLRFRINSGECDFGILIITLDNPIDTNLTGLLANQIMAEYGKPTLILNKRINNETGEITWEGSGRGFITPHVNDWRAYLEQYAMYAEGHAMAFGVGFTPDQLTNFKHLMTTSPMDITKSYDVDFVFQMTDNFDADILDVAKYDEMWGQGLTQPMVAIKNISLKKDDILLQGKGTLKLKLGNHRTTCIKFGATDIYNELQSLFPSDDATIKLNLIGTCALNDWGGSISPQLKLVDYDVSYVDTWGF